MWRSKGIDYPMIAVVMRYQSANTGNRVIDVLGKLVAYFGANFVIALALVTIRRSKAAKVRHRFNIPYKDVWHVGDLPKSEDTLRSFNLPVIYCHKSVMPFRNLTESKR